LNWDAIGAIAELAGAVGIILSLVYLALQIRQNTAQIDANSNLMRTESRRHWAAHVRQVNLHLAQDKNVAGLFLKGLASLNFLPPEEQMQFTLLFSEMLSALVTVFDETSEGMAPRGSLERHAPTMADLLRTPGGLEFWRTHGHRFGTAEFRNWVASDLLGSKQ
jgi:hypothetical protein